MKKIILFLASIMVVAVFSSEVSALPLFSRQTGMACSACHFQHFPMLNGFGRAFKSAGYTIMGAQGKVEGEGLAIPNTLNMAVLTTAGYEKSNQAASSTPIKTTGNGAFFVPGTGGELSLFFGGRVNENAGFLGEITTGGPAAANATATAGLGSAKLPIFFEMVAPGLKVPEGTRLGVIPYSTNLQGASYGFELLNTGANGVHQMIASQGMNGAHSMALSAQQYIGTNGTATGIALVANSPAGFINLSKYDQTGIAHGTLASLGSTYIRVAALFDLAGWDSGVGIQRWSGSSVNPTGTPSYVSTIGTQACTGGTCTVVYPTVPATFGITQTKATSIDGQMQGKVGERPVGIYVSYASSPAGGANTYNRDPAAVSSPSTVPVVYGTATKSAFNLSVEVGVIPEKATLGAATRIGKSGVAVGGASNASDNAIMLIATYKLAQNMIASISLTSAHGGYWDAVHQNALGSRTSTISLLALF